MDWLHVVPAFADACPPVFAPPPAAGSLTLDLLSTGGGSCDSHPLALCLASLKIQIDASCNVGINPLLASNVFVPGIWSSNSAGTYKRLVACPTWMRTPLAPTGGTGPDQVRAAIKTAIEQHVYGSNQWLKQSLSSMTWSIGTATLLTSVGGTCSLKYAVTQVNGWCAPVVAAAHAVEQLQWASRGCLAPVLCGNAPPSLLAAACRCRPRTAVTWIRSTPARFAHTATA